MELDSMFIQFLANYKVLITVYFPDISFCINTLLTPFKE